MIRKAPHAQSPAAKKIKATFSIRIPPDVRAALNEAAKCEDRSAGNLVLRAITEWLKAGGYLK